MAAVTERELKDKAHALMARGQLDAALEVFRQLICMNGKEAQYRLRHAEVSARLGRAQQAVGSYRIAAHLFAEAGRVAQAKAALHTAMLLDPRDLSLRRAVRELLPAPEVVQVQEDAPTGPARVFLGRGDDAPTDPWLPPVMD